MHINKPQKLARGNEKSAWISSSQRQTFIKTRKTRGGKSMAAEGKPDAQLFQLLSNLLQQDQVLGKRIGLAKGTNGLYYLKAPLSAISSCQVESLTNTEEVELRAKIEALGLEVTKVPSKPSKQLDELEIAEELDKLSARLDYVDEMISSAMASDPQVQSLLSSTAEVWMPVITANSDERRSYTLPAEDGSCASQGNTLDES